MTRKLARRRNKVIYEGRSASLETRNWQYGMEAVIKYKSGYMDMAMRLDMEHLDDKWVVVLTVRDEIAPSEYEQEQHGLYMKYMKRFGRVRRQMERWEDTYTVRGLEIDEVDRLLFKAPFGWTVIAKSMFLK